MKLFSKDDINGFWALFADNLANFIMVAALTKFVLNIPNDIIVGRIFPGLGIALIFGLGYYSYLARKVARETNRDDVTSLPYGISTPVMFTYCFGVMLPVYLATRDGETAWRVGVAAAFIGGIIEMFGAAIGPWVKKITPRAGMLGTLAGIAIVWIATVPLAEIFENPIIGFPAFAIVIIGLIAGVNFPYKIPAGLLAIIVGIVIGFLTGHSKISTEGIGIFLPVPILGDLLSGLKILLSRPEVLAVIIPIEIYNFIETMNNVESAEVAGDKYPVAKCQVVDGLGTMMGSCFGSPFPTTVYIGHPGYKKLGARAGYALMVGLAFVLIATFGLANFLYSLIPVACVAPMMVFVALVITGQAFSECDKKYAMAVSVALIPHISNIIVNQANSVWSGLNDLYKFASPSLAPFSTPELIATMLGKGVHYAGHNALAQGAIISGLLWGAIIAFCIDKKFKMAAAFTLTGALFSMIGLIHAEKMGLNFSHIFYGYVITGCALLVFGLLQPKKEENKTYSPL